MKEDKTIHFILTGGTIDSYFDPAKDSVVIGKRTMVPDFIKKLKLHNKCEFAVATLKDSRDLRYYDRKSILELVKKSKHEMIIITHGTYTMPDTAQFLKDNLLDNKKTIVFTGSMIPLKGFELTDSQFNLGYAVACVQTLPVGVYLCMNGRVFDPQKVDKNRIEGRFEEI